MTPTEAAKRLDGQRLGQPGDTLYEQGPPERGDRHTLKQDILADDVRLTSKSPVAAVGVYCRVTGNGRSFGVVGHRAALRA